MSSVTNPTVADTDLLYQILELARWAPSGDNVQPWRFKIVSGRRLLVYGFDTRTSVVYDREGIASQLALGCLLENITIAARAFGLMADVYRVPDFPETEPTFDINFYDHQDGLKTDPLAAFIKTRTTNRRPFSRRPLSDNDRTELEAALPPGYQVIWLEKRHRYHMAKLLYNSALIRLITREAFAVHSSIIEWNAQFSEDRIPDQAVGLDPLTRRLMRFAMKSWTRVQILNRFCLGTVLPRLELDFLPGLCCAGHFLICAKQELKSVDDYISAGRAVQRFWLTATKLGLQFQPEMTPLIFAAYAWSETRFTENQRAWQRARDITSGLAKLYGYKALTHGAFLGRLGYGSPPRSRSTRRPLYTLHTPR